VEQQGGQLNAGLPAAGQLGDGAFEVRALQFESTGDFAAFPFRLAAVALQEIDRRLARQERVVLAEVSEPQSGMPHDLAPIQLFFAQQDPQQRAFAGPVAAHKTHLGVVSDGSLGVFQQDLVAVAFESVFDLEQHSHRRNLVAVLPHRNARKFVMGTPVAA